MDRTTAAARLGLSGVEDASGITRAYGQRLGQLQQQLVSAADDKERHASQAQLAELLDAYEFLTQTGRHAHTRDDGATQARPAGAAGTEMGWRDTSIRLEPGAVLSDRLEVGAMLGQGGMGYVFAARDRLKNENVAIKVLRHDLLFSDEAKERFLAEAKVSCNFSHPNIVNVYDVGVSGGNYYFSMELLKGQTLRQRIEHYQRERRLFTITEVNEITRQMVDALRHAHRHIVHRDIKPENIWLEDDGTVKLMDFGIARAYSNSDMTRTGMTLGTAYYMAPEQRTAAKDVDWRADQYSLGVVLYELMAGTVPMGAAQPLEKLRRDLPRRYARALMRAISPRPEDRWPSLQALLNELTVRQSSPLVAAVLVGVVAATAAAAALYISQNRDTGPAQQNAAESADIQQPGGKSGGPAADAGGAASVGPSRTDTDVAPPVSSASTRDPTGAGVGDAVVATPPDAPTTPAAIEPSQPATTAPPSIDHSSAPGAADNQGRQQCVAQCERDNGECQSINRRGKQACMRAAAFGASTGDSFSVRQNCDRAARDADRECLTQLQGCRVTCQ